MERILELRNITKRFPGLVANDAISFTALKGEIHALVGENGAGKSTLMKIITGLYQQDEGEIWLRNEQMQLAGPRDAILQGIGMVHQHFMLVNRFTVLQNIILGYEQSTIGVINFKKARAKVAEICQMYDFKLDLDAQVGDLSVGHQQRVEIVKVLYRGADILILDEPTAVLTPQETAELVVNLHKLKAQGKVILFISHKLNEVLAIADRITVLRRGKVVNTVAAAVTDKKSLAEMMVGRPVLFKQEKPPSKIQGPVLTVRSLSSKGCLERHPLCKVSFTVHGGEIYGIAGVEGNGQREVIEAVMGLTPYDEGDILIKEQSIKKLTVQEIRRIGVGYIPEDRHQRALVMPMTVWENAVLGLQRRPEYSSWWKLCIEAIKEFTRKKVDEFDIRLGSLDLPIRNLSGGNQQKVILARELSTSPELIIAAQPVRGLDIGAIEFVHKKLLEARSSGKAILLIAADLEEVLSVADRVGIMYDGHIVKEFVPGELDLNEIGQYMLGAGRKAG